MTELKPKRTSFLFARVMSGLIVTTVLAVGVFIGGAAVEQLALGALAAAGLWVGLMGLTLWSANVAWTKERYEIHAGHLVAHAGGIASDDTTELDVKNITHVKQRLSWIRYRFFDVGDVIVQSAGSSSAEVVFRSVRQPDAVYDSIRALMRDNGFSMRGGELLHSEHPSTLGAIVECLSILLGMSFLVTWLFGAGIAAAAGAGAVGVALVAVGGGLLGLAVLAGLALHFLDMKQRTYEIYDDVVEYREGFLSRTNAFIPYENIADAESKQTPFDRLLGLYDVKVSCQGSGSEVSFRRLARGPEVQRALRGRVDAAQAQRELKQAQLKQAQLKPQVEAAGPLPGQDAGEDAPTVMASGRPPAELVPASEAWTADLKMNTARAFVGGALLRALGTTYSVGPSSVSSSFKLLSQQQLEFAYDKVTGVQVRTTPLDGLFGTFTVRIWSIGSSTPLDLAHVPRASVDLPALLRQAGVPGGPARATLPADFGPGVWLRANAITPFVLALSALLGLSLGLIEPELALSALAPVGLIGLIALSFPLLMARYKRQLLTLHDHHMEHQSGIFWRQHVYARYDDMKKLSVRRYWGTDSGSLTVFVAGETQLQTKNGKAGAVIPNTFTAHYLPDVTPFKHTLDPLLQGQLEPAEALVARGGAEGSQGPEFRPAVANSVLTLLLVGLFFPPLWLLVPYTVLSVKRRAYRVEPERVVIEEGVLYRTHTSVLYERIDSLKQNQGVFGKAFGNGSVTLFTAGSSRPDLVLANAPGFKELYAAIRQRYGG